MTSQQRAEKTIKQELSLGYGKIVIEIRAEGFLDPDRFQKQEQKVFQNYCPECGHGFNSGFYKSTPEPEKCFKCSDCGQEYLTQYQWTYYHENGKCKPKDEVEAKIRFILDNQPMPIGRSLKELRELVELARKA